MNRIAAMVAYAALLAAWTQGVAEDAIEIFGAGGKAQKGSLAGYSDGHVLFQGADGAGVKVPPNRVQKLTIDPPAPVTVVMKTRGEKYDAVLKDWQRGTITVVKGGKETKVPLTMIDEIRVSLSRALKADAGESGDVDVSDLVEKGAITVIHLHCDALVASTRQGNYVDARAADVRGKVVVKRVNIPAVNGEPDWNSPVAKRFGISSAPQFWFYGRTGKLIQKLTDRFTETDIDAAFKSALRGR